MTTVNCTTSVGRPRAFDTDTALAKALEVFWRNGYDGTSLAELTEAMGINKPSLYAAFGNKDQLFLKAIEFYEKRPCSFFLPALEKPTAYEVAEHILYGAAINMADKSHPQGCLLVQGALSCSAAATTVKEALLQRRVEGHSKLRERFERAKQDGDLPLSADAETLARYLGTVLHGMAVQANSGVTSEQLHQVAKMALQAFERP
jgi:AcrR family transcriptional regulator